MNGGDPLRRWPTILPAHHAPPPLGRRRFHRARSVLYRVLLVAAVLFAAQALVVVSLRWWSPPHTSFMLWHERDTLAHQWVSLDHVSRHMVAAVLMHEDPEFGTRQGAFDIDDFRARAERYRAGEQDEGGSTIQQQLAKNLFLWPHRSAARKGVEAVLALELNFALSKRRMMELYLNYAQFGTDLFGVCAATWYYFDTPPWAMTPDQGRLLVALLPAPEEAARAVGGGLDLGPTASALTRKHADRAFSWVHGGLAWVGGWAAAVATIGVHDAANDHSASRGNTDACSTMPTAVAERLAVEDPAFVSRGGG